MAKINKKCQADPGEICRLAIELGVSNATAAVLLNRGINSEEIGRQFLDCDDSVINDPFDMLGMYEAVDFINEAIENEKQITIYGDYDVDGVTSSCIMYKYLKSLGANVNCYIPNRFTEGYGMNSDAIEKIRAKGSEVIIALDCGITSVSEVHLAKEYGLDVMIADHHNPPEVLPEADVIIDPKQEYCEYPFKELCSAGLALKIVEAHGGRKAAEEYYDIAAIGIIADVVSLLGENRYYVKKGIEKINKAPSVGVKALKSAAGYQDKDISARGVAFGMAPRLNAAGRLASAKESLKLFLAEDPGKANELAQKLNEYNECRKTVEKQIYDETNRRFENTDICAKRIIVSAGEDWNKGVIGIAASRFVEKYNRPAIVISCSDDVCTASARSIPGFDIYDALSSCNDLFTRFGGHSQAAGFSLLRENIPEFTARIEKYAEEHIPEELLIPQIDCEFALSPTDISMQTAKELLKLDPFGKDNEPPLFFANRLSFNNAILIGKEKNVLKANLDAGGMTIDCVGFGKANYLDAVNCKMLKSAVFSVDINEWQGIEKVQLGLKEIKLSILNEKDADAVDEVMDARLFDAFTNGFVSKKKAFEASVDINTMYDELSAHKMGTLVVVTDKKSLTELFSLIAAGGIADEIDIHLGSLPDGHEFGANTVLVMPHDGVIPNGEFARVFVPEYLCREKLDGISHISAYKSFDPFENEGTLTRDDFVKVYKALHEFAYKLSAWSSIDSVRELLLSEAKCSVSPFGLKLVLVVFDELGFIKFEEADGMLRIAFADNIRKRQLSESKLFEKYINTFNV